MKGEVARLELSRKLHDLSRWKDTHFSYRPTPSNGNDNYRVIDIVPNIPSDIPAYDLGYLLQKIGECADVSKVAVLHMLVGFVDDDEGYAGSAAKLAIELIKQGVITPGEEA